MRLGRERILMGSEAKAGKSTAIAKLIKGLPNSRFVILVADDGFAKVAVENEIVVGKMDQPTDKIKPAMKSEQVLVFPNPTQWMDFYYDTEMVQRWIAEGKLGPNDWVITEALDITYDEIISEYAEVMVDSTVAVQTGNGNRLAPSSWASFIEKRKKKAPILEGSDYNAIYTELRKCINYYAYQCPCNWIATVGIEEIRTGQYADKEEQEFYASVGMPVKFQGYKKVPRMVDTLVLFYKSMGSGYTFQVWADRGVKQREPNKIPERVKNEDFYKQFLAVGGNQVKQNGLTPPPVLVGPPIV